jgi:hypothetical protein
MPSPSKYRPRLSLARLSLLTLWAAAVAGAYGLYSGAITMPERFNPWAPLDVKAEPNFLTPYKLARAEGTPRLCLAALAQTGMQFEPLPNRVTGAGCGFENAVRVRSAEVRLGQALPLSCPMALSFAMWERHALQPAAQRRFGERVVAVDTLGSYACRNVNTGEGATPDAPGRQRSRHATANALDLAGVTLANGKHITVLRDFQRKAETSAPAAEALLLDDLHTGACRYFRGVLGPDYNAVHRDHFHLETGGYSMCR